MLLLVGVKDGMEDVVPLARKPVTPLGDEPLQVYVVPPTEDVNVTAVVAEPEHTI